MIGESLVAMMSYRLKDLVDGRLVEGDLFFKTDLRTTNHILRTGDNQICSTGWFDLHDPNWKKAGQIRMTLVFTAKSDIAIKDPEYSTYKTPETYFPSRPNCKVRLYQDADTPPGSDQVSQPQATWSKSCDIGYSIDN